MKWISSNENGMDLCKENLAGPKFENHMEVLYCGLDSYMKSQKLKYE
jgi:hypothetical protein